MLAMLASGCFAVAAAGCGEDPAEPARGGVSVGTIVVGDDVRSYTLLIPPNAPDTGRIPLILAFHGALSSGEQFMTLSGLNGLAISLRSAIAYPDALVGNWAEDCGCNNADRLGVNDTGFVSLLIDRLEAAQRIDRDRIHVLGFSQGGLFAQRLACQMADGFRGVTVVAATMSTPLAQRCDPAAPLPILMLHGLNDAVFPWEGGGGGATAVLGAEATARQWAGRNGCESEPTVDEDVSRLHMHWQECDGGAGVELIGAKGGGHAWSFGQVNTLDELQRFILAH